MAKSDSRFSGIAEKYRDKPLEGMEEKEILEDICHLLDVVEARDKEIGWAKRRIKELERGRKGESKVGRTHTAMWAIRGFTVENRLYVKMAGEFDYKSAKQFSNHLVTVLDSLRSGCSVIVDAQSIQDSGDQKNAFYIRKVACTFVQMNVAHLIRIAHGLPKKVKSMVDGIFDDLGLTIIDVSDLNEASLLLKKKKHHLRA